jgi:hypothetical protein
MTHRSTKETLMKAQEAFVQEILDVVKELGKEKM